MGVEKLFAVIDVETTGGTPFSSRITDISVFLTDGHRLIDEFSSLVNPMMPIPPFISELTGIDDEMVASAPTFDEIAQQIIDITQGAIFVAHNVNFDYGMVRGEFARLKYSFNREKLCTVRLARQFIPGHRSYSLGNICRELGIPINGRHRARGDAEATLELFRRIYDLSDGEPSMSDQQWIKSLPEELPKNAVNRLPDEPGLFYFYNAAGHVIYIGASADIYKKVTGMIKSKTQKWKKILSEVTDIDFQTTGVELIAELRLSGEIVKHAPKYNKVAKESASWSIAVSKDLFGYMKLSAMINNQPVVGQSFKNKKEADNHLKIIRNKYQLCAQLCGLDREVCAKDPLNKCPGACQYLEPADQYNNRAEKAINGNTAGSFVIVERISEEEHAFVLVEKGHYLGYGTFTAYDEGIRQLTDLKDYLVPDDPAYHKSALIYSYHNKHKSKVHAL